MAQAAAAAATVVAAKKRKLATSSQAPRKRTKPTDTDNDNDQDARITKLETGIQESQKNLNNLVALLKIAQVEAQDDASSLSAVLALARTFTRLIAEGRLTRSKKATESEQTVLKWLKARYKEYQRVLFGLISEGVEVQDATALALGMQLIKQELLASKGPIDSVWPNTMWPGLVKAILAAHRETDLSDKLREKYLQPFDDARHQFFLVAKDIVQSDEDQDGGLRSAIVDILSKLDTPTSSKLKTFFATRPSETLEPIKLTPHKKQAQQAWLAVLRCPLHKEERKQILSSMSFTIVPWFNNPEMLMDFLTDAFNVGGSTSLLALSGMFSLMTEKNLDYPAFYTKLYALLDADVLHSKHRSRFFRLLNTFMSSTHLPANLVASFIKRLSRLALDAPPAGIVAVVPWIYNMFKAHPATTFMMHRVPRTEEARAEIEELGFQDPFDMDEPDPYLTNAIDSCVWELVSLQTHYHPNVASLARIISQQFTKAHYNLEDFLNHSYAGLIGAELGKELKRTPELEYEIPRKVFTDVTGDPAALEGLLSRAIAQT